MEPTAPQETCFEAGVKFGSLYHQFAGTPISPDSADSLAAAMEEAIGTSRSVRRSPSASAWRRWKALSLRAGRLPKRPVGCCSSMNSIPRGQVNNTRS